MKKSKGKIILTALALLVVFVLAIGVKLLWFGLPVELHRGMADYEQRRAEYPFSEYVLPQTGELPQGASFKYRYRREWIGLFFFAESLLLAVTYDADTYEQEKEKLAHRKWLTQELRSGDTDYLIPAHEFYIKSFHFRIPELREDVADACYPKSFGMIATSDEKHTIVYLYFYDPEMDYISEKAGGTEMEGFVRRCFSYWW